VLDMGVADTTGLSAGSEYTPLAALGIAILLLSSLAPPLARRLQFWLIPR